MIIKLSSEDLHDIRGLFGILKRRKDKTGSAEQIAFDLGFDDYTYFSRLFSRNVGMSPKAFRDKYLE